MRPSILLVAACCVGVPALVFAQTAPTGKPAINCDASLALRDGKVTSATEVGSDPTRGIHAPHCEVGSGIGTEIHFEVPLPDAWNFPFLMGGGGSSKVSPTIRSPASTPATRPPVSPRLSAVTGGLNAKKQAVIRSATMDRLSPSTPRCTIAQEFRPTFAPHKYEPLVDPRSPLR